MVLLPPIIYNIICSFTNKKTNETTISDMFHMCAIGPIVLIVLAPHSVLPFRWKNPVRHLFVTKEKKIYVLRIDIKNYCDIKERKEEKRKKSMKQVHVIYI